MGIPIKPIAGVAAAAVIGGTAGHVAGVLRENPPPRSRESNMYTPKPVAMAAVAMLGGAAGAFMGIFGVMARHWHSPTLPAAEMAAFAIGGALGVGTGAAAMINANFPEVTD